MALNRPLMLKSGVSGFWSFFGASRLFDRAVIAWAARRGNPYTLSAIQPPKENHVALRAERYCNFICY
jgi:hypothetical protein